MDFGHFSSVAPSNPAGIESVQREISKLKRGPGSADKWEQASCLPCGAGRRWTTKALPLLGAAFFWAGSIHQAGGQPSPAWQLLAEARVDSSGIFLDQLVQPVPPVALPRIRLAPAPPLGQTAVFSRQQISALLQTNAPDLLSTNWSGARQIRISRRTRQLAEAELTDLLTAVLQRDEVKSRGQLELQLTRPWTSIAVPDEPLTLKMGELPFYGLNPSCLASIELWSGKERVGAWQLALHARVWREIAVARSALLRGQLLREADIVMQRSDVLMVRQALTDLSSQDAAMELAENIPAGSPVLARAVRMRPLVRRGRIVEGIYREGTLMISLKVETLEDGLLGQTVRVRNPKTRRELYGKVENEQTILIAL